MYNNREVTQWWSEIVPHYNFEDNIFQFKMGISEKVTLQRALVQTLTDFSGKYER